MNSTFGHFGRYGRYGDQASEQTSKLVTCRPGAFPGQIICSAARSGPVPVDPETGLPIPQALPAVDVLPQYAGFRFRSRGGRYGRWGASVSSSSKTSSSPTISTSIASTPSFTSVVSSPIVQAAASTYSSSVVSPSYSTSSVVPSVSTGINSVIPSVTSGTVVQTTGSGDTTVASTPSTSSSYVNPMSSSMFNQGWGPMSAEGQVQREGDPDGPGQYADDDGDDGEDDGGDGDGGGSDDQFPGQRNRKRHGRGYPASRRRRRRNRRRARYSGFGAYQVMYGRNYGVGEILGSGKMAGRPYYKKQGSGGYIYLQYTDDGGIGVDSSSPARKGQYIAPMSSSVWYAITKEIGPLAKQKQVVANYYKKSALAKASQVPTSVVVTGQNNKGLNALFAAIGAGSASDGKKLVAAAAVAHGPEVAESAAAFLQEKNSSPAAIQKKIDRLNVKLAAAKAMHDTVKVKKLQAKIKGLQARLLAAQSDVDSLDTTALDTSTGTFPWKYALGGLGLLLVLGLAAKMAAGR